MFCIACCMFVSGDPAGANRGEALINLFSDDVRRDPFPMYAQFRRASPVLNDPASGLWVVFDFDGVKRVLGDTEAFSSRYGPDWLIFADPPRHTKLRALVSKA